MIIPVRCISCGTPVAGKWEKFKEETAKGKPAGKVLDELGVKRYCCRALFLTHVDTMEEIARFKQHMVVREEKGYEKAKDFPKAKDETKKVEEE